MKNENKLKYEKYIMNISLIGSAESGTQIAVPEQAPQP